MVLSCVIKMSKIRSQETHDEHLLKKKLGQVCCGN